jgi:TPR repeat protein
MTEQEISNLLKQAKGLCESEKWDEAFPILSSIADQSDEALELLGECYSYDRGTKTDSEKAFEIFTQLAPKNDAAKKLLGDCYFYGFGTKENYQEAERIYSECAEKGDKNAQLMLGQTYLNEDENQKGFETFRKLYEESHGAEAGFWLAKCYYYGWGTEKDGKKAFGILLDASKENDDALELLGECYSDGRGTEKDGKKAFHIFSELAEKDSKAKKSLGDCYFFGCGVKRNYKEAERIYSECADFWNANARYMLGRTYLREGKLQKGFNIFKQLHDGSRGANSDYWLAQCYYYGWGTEKDGKKAFGILLDASKENDDALELLGECYYRGTGTEESNEEAFKIFAELAPRNVRAKKRLGDCFYHGFGIEENNQEAKRIYAECTEKGDKDAQFMLGRIYLREGEPQKGFNIFKELYRSYRGANSGYWLAKCYYYGWGTEKDGKKAFGILLDASKENDDALELLGECYLYGEGTKANGEKAFAIFSKLAPKDEMAKKLLGDCYFFGVKAKTNYSKAEKIYQECAKKDDENAQYMLGRTYLAQNKLKEGFEILKDLYEKNPGGNLNYWLAKCYLYGWGTKKDQEKTYSILKSLPPKNDDYLELLGEYYYGKENRSEEEAKRAFSIFKKVAGKSQDAKQRLAQCYCIGIGTKIDYQKALYYVKKANQFGINGLSETIMAVCLSEDGTKKANFKKAIEYLKKGVCLKSGLAANCLGSIYETGYYGERSLANAYHYYQIADRLGDTDSTVQTVRFLVKGIGTKKNPKAAIALLQKRIKENPNVPAYKSALGALYFEPEYTEAGIRRNPSLAFKYVSEAVEANDPRGYFLLGKMYKEGIGVAKDTKKAEDCLQEAKEAGYSIQGESPDLQLAHLECFKRKPDFDKVINMVSSSVTEISKDNDPFYWDIQRKMYNRTATIDNDQLMSFQTVEKKLGFIRAKNYVITSADEKQLEEIDKQGQKIMNRFLANEAKERTELLQRIKQAESAGATAEEVDGLLEDYLGEVDKRAKKYAQSQKMAKYYQMIKGQFRAQLSSQILMVPAPVKDSLEAAMTIMSAYESGVLHGLKDFSPISAPLTKAFEGELFAYLGKPLYEKLSECYPLPRFSSAWPKGFRDHYPNLNIGDYQELLDKKKNPIPNFEKDILSCFYFSDKGYRSLDELLEAIGEIRKLRNLSGHKNRMAEDDAEELKKELLGDHQDGFFYRFPSTLAKGVASTN